MDIIFVGGFFPKHLTDTILSKSKKQIQNAANIFQWAFIKGLEANLGKCIQLVTAPYIGWYPLYYKDIILRTSTFNNSDQSTACVMVGFLNLPIIKNLFKYVGLSSCLNTIKTPSCNTMIIVYSLDLAYVKAAIKAKKYNSKLKVCVIIPDLHEFPGDCSFLYNFYIRYYEKPAFYSLLHEIDCFVVLTDKMVDYLNIGHKPWVRIEGLYESQNEQLRSSIKRIRDDGVRKILYTGTLDYKYGIRNLLDAFDLIKADNYKLWICGSGVGSALVKDRALADKRISYFGNVSNKTVIELQREATLLINPRNTIGEYNKYSFPSKTMEYFASGTPTLMYKLDGIPEDYFNYCYTISDNSIESLSTAMQQTCQLSGYELVSKGKSAREFIINNKSAVVQCGKVLNMLKNVF